VVIDRQAVNDYDNDDAAAAAAAATIMYVAHTKYCSFNVAEVLHAHPYCPIRYGKK
jgi:hypothetical protein